MSPEIARVLAAAPETKHVEIGRGALDQTSAVFDRYFRGRLPLVVADPKTFAVAGQAVLAQLRNTGYPGADPFVFSDPGFYAESSFVSRLEEQLRRLPDAVPIAVGSGTVNDVTKLASHRTQRRYLAVATAASMDGYTAFGASITHQGAKQTFGCGAPLAVVADQAMIARAPAHLNAAGYADLLAKITSGADWIIADVLGIESRHPIAWELAQGNLRRALADPDGIRTAKATSVEALTEGLLLSGFAMQFASSSRPASGAEHQFSHLWDMQHHTFQGGAPLHGFKVGIGTRAVAALYDFLLRQPLEKIDVNRCCEQWPDPGSLEKIIADRFSRNELRTVALTESRAKYIDAAVLREQLGKLRERWPLLREQLVQQLLPQGELKRLLQSAGAPVEPEQIGLSRVALRESFRSAYYIRRRFTVLDVAVRADLLEPALADIFGERGPWPVNET